MSRDWCSCSFWDGCCCYMTAAVVGADVVGADVLGADVAGADVVGADVVGAVAGWFPKWRRRRIEGMALGEVAVMAAMGSWMVGT